MATGCGARRFAVSAQFGEFRCGSCGADVDEVFVCGACGWDGCNSCAEEHGARVAVPAAEPPAEDTGGAG
jgi:hypothetical protein